MYRFAWEWGILEGFHQISNDVLTKLFLVLTQFGGEMFLIAVIGLFYFCLNKEKGEKLGFIVLFSGAFNGVLKGLVKAKRPYEYVGKEHLIKGSVGSTSATGSSFPSGHSQNSASLTPPAGLEEEVVNIICIVLMIIVRFPALSRGPISRGCMAESFWSFDFLFDFIFVYYWP